MEKVIFGAGCFWGVEHTFRTVPGVVDVACGYSAGTTVDPTYEEICTGTTGHAEVVQVDFNPEQVSFEQLLGVFFANHDPTTLNKQGRDSGTQYRSAVFFLTPEQEASAQAAKTSLAASDKFANPIVTEITPAAPFYRAEEYHQRYYEKNGVTGCNV